MPASAPITVREHEPEERVQVAGKGKKMLLVPDDCENVTVPSGDDTPRTVVVQVLVAPTVMDVGMQMTAVLEVALETANVKSKAVELDAWCVSPT